MPMIVLSVVDLPTPLRPRSRPLTGAHLEHTPCRMCDFA